MKLGIVYLVGAGPGDLGLLTLKGKSLLETADVIFYDYLANPEFLKGLKGKTIYVGKKGAGSVEQFKIETQLIAEAKKGKRVVRLKGGDPFIFGRGGEEAQALAQAHIPFEIVPGVTSAIAVPAYAGIPLTHRDCTSEVVFVTGHEDPNKQNYANGAPNWEALARMGTVVFLMGTVNLDSNLKNLIKAGKPADTPCAFIQWGTHTKQKTILGTLENLAAKVVHEKLGPPAIVVVGKVAALSKEIRWFENLPLFGKKVVVTRAAGQASELSNLLREKGAQVFELPTIQFKPPRSFKPLDAAIYKASQFDWIVFTSANAVHVFWERLEKLKLDLRVFGKSKIAVIGAKTAKLLSQKGLRPDLVPKDFSAEGLIKAFDRTKIKGNKIFIPRSAKGREFLIEELKRRKCKVVAIDAYQTIPPKISKQELETIWNQKPDWVLFTSSSTVEYLVLALKQQKMESVLNSVQVACIGPVTQKTAVEFGMKVDLVSRQATVESLVNGLSGV